MANFNYEEVKQKLKNEELERKEAEKLNAKAMRQIGKIEKIKNQLFKEEEKLREILENNQSTNEQNKAEENE